MATPCVVLEYHNRARTDYLTVGPFPDYESADKWTQDRATVLRAEVEHEIVTLLAPEPYLTKGLRRRSNDGPGF